MAKLFNDASLTERQKFYVQTYSKNKPKKSRIELVGNFFCCALYLFSAVGNAYLAVVDDNISLTAQKAIYLSTVLILIIYPLSAVIVIVLINFSITHFNDCRFDTSVDRRYQTHQHSLGFVQIYNNSFIINWILVAVLSLLIISLAVRGGFWQPLILLLAVGACQFTMARAKYAYAEYVKGLLDEDINHILNQDVRDKFAALFSAMSAISGKNTDKTGS